MNIDGKHYRTIWEKKDDSNIIQIIDQTLLPHKFAIRDLKTVEDVATAIKDMYVRGAGLIGASAGYGMYLATLHAPGKNINEHLHHAAGTLKNTRPTAKNLEWAVQRQLNAIKQGATKKEKTKIALQTAREITDEDALNCKKIGEHGVKLIEKISKSKNGEPVNILTHCNAGWLAFVDYGSATAPIYEAWERGIKLHIYVDETRPRNQGANLTAWELGKHGIPHSLIVDNAGGHLMQHDMVDMVIVGTDRTTATGDVANKIGTYLKALAARDNNLPFYVALPSSTFDWEISNGVKEIPIEERDPQEILTISGLIGTEVKELRISPPGTTARNFAFDVTPSRLVTALITERGICKANKESIAELFPDMHKITP